MNHTSKENNETPRVFISYSHDSPEHKTWVLNFASELVKRGVDVILDAWNLRLGADAAKFMERSVKEAHRVLMICTEKYVQKFDQGEGGSGYEGMIVTGELIKDQSTYKFIPVIRQTGQLSLPTSFASRLYVNLSGPEYDNQFELLLRELHGAAATPKPKLGHSPFKPDTDPVVKGTRIADLLENLNEEDLVTGILYGRLSLKLFDELDAQDLSALEQQLPILAAGGSWSRMLAAYLVPRLAHKPEYLVSILFDGEHSWRVREFAAHWLSSTKNSLKPKASELLRERVEDDDIDNVRMVLVGAGALADFSLIEHTIFKRNALGEGYYNEKLGIYVIEAYLQAYLNSNEEWRLDLELSSLVRAFDVTTDQKHMFLGMLNLFDDLRGMQRSKSAKLFRKLSVDRHTPLLLALVLMLEASPNPHLIDELLELRGDDFLRQHALLAIAAMGSRESYSRIEDLSADPLAAAARCYAIGVNCLEAEIDHILHVVDQHGYYQLTYHYALWSLGELAAQGNARALARLETEKNDKADGHTRALSWLGIAKAGRADKEGLKEAADLADEFVERVILGIAGALVEDIEVLERSLLASSRNLAPIWRLQSNIYRDLRRALKEHWADPGNNILKLLDCGM
jgi:TIR domain